MPTLEERLRLVVDATTGSAEANFGKLTDSAEKTARASDTAADAVGSAADAVARARAKEADAAGKLSVAQSRLDELREKGTASASQLVAAEERVAAAERQVQIAAGNTSSALEAQNRVHEATPASVDKASRASGRLSDQMGELKGSLVGIVAGVSLADWLSESFGGFLEGARGANALSQSMNSTIEEGGRLATLFSTLGLETDDLLEIQAEFASKTKDGLTQLGTELQHNSDGTVNWANTLTDTLEQLQKIPDATERNRLGFSMFGEEGYKQLSRLLTSGVSVEEALDRIGTPFSAKDIAAAQEYDAALTRVKLAGGELGRTVARELLPFVTGAVEALGAVASIVSIIPTPIAVATVAAVALGVTGFSPTAAAGARLASVVATVRAEVAIASATMIEGGAAAGVLGGGMMLAAGAGRGMLAMLGGPLGIALIAAGAAFYFASKGSDALRDHAHDAALELEKMTGSADAVAIATRKSANDLEENAGYWERSAAYVKGHEAGLHGWEKTVNGLVSPFQRLTMGFGDTADTAKGFELQIEEARKELGAYGAQQEIAQTATKGLNDLIAEGTTTGQEFTDALKASADASAASSRTSDFAAAALEAYHASTDGAVAAVRGLIDAELSRADAGYGFLSAMDDLKAATDDEKTSVDEVAQAHTRFQEAALAAGDAAADAAVAAAKAAGTIVTPLDEARVRADAMLADLRDKLNTPGLTDGARADLQGLIDRLQEASDKGDVNALVTITGVDTAKEGLDTATEDRDTNISVETRGGPAVVEYLNKITNAERLAIIRVESRNGPAVREYLDGLTLERLAIIRVETRGGPAVQRYLDDLAADRSTRINVSRGAGSPAAGGGSGLYGAPSLAAVGAGTSRLALGTITLDLALQGTVDRAQLTKAEQGRVSVEGLRAYSQRNGTGWLRELL